MISDWTILNKKHTSVRFPIYLPNCTIAEAGVFNAIFGGVMLFRTVFDRDT
jgi:hypothetical protein